MQNSRRSFIIYFAMSFQDRDYYRDGSNPESPFGAAPQVRISAAAWIIMANSCVFLLMLLMAGLRDSPLPDFVRQYFYTWPEGVLVKVRLWQLVTGAFIHADFLHILFNMLFLYMFGKGLEDITGRRDFVFFYMASAVAGSLCYVIWGIVAGGNVPSVGASGAVMGVVVLYAIHRPRQVVLVWGMIPMQVRWLAALFVGADLLMFVTRSDSGVAHCAHLGGALYALLHWYFDLRLGRILALFGRPGSGKAYKLPEANPFRGVPPMGSGEFHGMDGVEKRVDELLNKISKHGLTSLSDEERAFLREASRKYGDKRE